MPPATPSSGAPGGAARPVRAARGTRDVLPEERAAWAIVERGAREVAHRFGYRPIDTPVMERVELIERGVGGETDIVSRELFRLVKRGEEDLVLRPEGTAGVVRAYFEHHLDQGPQPARLFLLGPMFRYDRPQQGRFRQFHQFDVEAIGDASPAVDAEVIEMAWEWMAELGLNELRLELNSIGDGRCRPAYLEKLVAYYRRHLGEVCEQDRSRLRSNPLRLLDCKEPGCQPVKAAAPRITDHLCHECAAAFQEVRRLLDGARIQYVLNPYLVRGLDYYTRTVFELQHEAIGGAQNSLGGGGRYDGLAGTLGFPETPAVGFAAGIERVVMMMGREGELIIPAPPAQLVVLPADSGLALEAAAVARRAREAVPAAVDYSDRSLKAKMRAANRSGPRWVAILNREEAARGVVQLKELASGNQVEVSWEDLPDLLSGRPLDRAGRVG